MNEVLFEIIKSLKNEKYSWAEIFKMLTYSSPNSMKLSYNRKKFYKERKALKRTGTNG